MAFSPFACHAVPPHLYLHQPGATSSNAGMVESHGTGMSPERLKKTRASFKRQPMFMAWPERTNRMGLFVPGPGEMPVEDTDVSWSQLHPCHLPSAGLFRHIAFLLSLLPLSHYKGALNFLKHLISNVPEMG